MGQVADREAKYMSLIRAGLFLALCVAACGAAPTTQQTTIPNDIPGAYRMALDLSPTPLMLRSDYDSWVADGSDPNADYVLNRFQSVIRTARAAAAMRIGQADLSGDCLDLYLDQGCGVRSGGFLNTDVDASPRLFWQLQSGASGDEGVGMGIVYLAPEPDGRLKPFLWAFEAAEYQPPTIHHPEPDLTLLVARGVSRGSAAAIADLVFVWRDGGWRQLDIYAWDYQDPRFGGLQSFMRSPINYDELMTVTDLWRPDDGHCCPTGGRAMLDFKIEDDRLLLESVRRLGAD